MNRWETSLENSGLKFIIGEVEKKINELSLEEIIDENLISEILRLKKIISYFSNIVNLIDPEISDPKQYPGIIDIFKDCDTHFKR